MHPCLTIDAFSSLGHCILFSLLCHPFLSFSFLPPFPTPFYFFFFVSSCPNERCVREHDRYYSLMV